MPLPAMLTAFAPPTQTHFVQHRRATPPTCSDASPARAPARPTRRRVLAGLLGLPLLPPEAARADRTGKYSTKLTAKRRYLPRIARGVAALGALSDSLHAAAPWQGAAAAFAADVEPDLRAALALFATTFFSEGNRIGEKERLLGACVDELFASVAAMAAAAESDDQGRAAAAWGGAARAANRYVEIAKLQETVPLIPLE